MSESLTLHNELLEADYWTPRGKAILLGDIAEVHKHKGEWEEARDGYSRALQIQILPIHNVFLAECLLQLERHEEAFAALAEVETESLSNNEQIDYAFVTAGVAIQAGTREQLEAARTGLKELHIPEPLFRERRDSILLNVQEAISSGWSKPLVIGTKRLIANTLRSATTYLILKPSFMSVGVDIGKWVEKQFAKSEQPPKPPTDSGKSVSRPDPSSKRK